MPGYNSPKPVRFLPGRRPISARALNYLTDAIPAQQRGVQGVYVQDYGDRQTIGLRNPTPVLPSPQNYLKQFVVVQEYDDLLYCIPLELPIVSRVNPNYSVCVPLNLGTTVIDPTTNNPVIARSWVAKPYTLQRTPWDGQQIPFNNSTATVSYFPPPLSAAARTQYNQRFLVQGTAPNQTITSQSYPAYTPGEVIVALKTLTGYREPGSTEFEKLTDPPPKNADILAADLLLAESQPQQELVIWQDQNAAARAWPINQFSGAASYGTPSLFPFQAGSSYNYQPGVVGLLYDTSDYLASHFDDRWTVPFDGTYLVGGQGEFLHTKLTETGPFVGNPLQFTLQIQLLRGSVNHGIWTDNSNLDTASVWTAADGSKYASVKVGLNLPLQLTAGDRLILFFLMGGPAGVSFTLTDAYFWIYKVG